jgi:hypothetical protein
MIETTAHVRSMIEDDGSLLVSFVELAAYYRASGAVADFFRALPAGTAVTFMHDHLVVIGSARLAD